MVRQRSASAAASKQSPLRTEPAHVLDGRVRFSHPRLRARNDLALAVEAALAARPGIVSAKANPLTGSVLVRFTSGSVQEIGSIIDACLEGRAIPAPAAAVQADSRGEASAPAAGSRGRAWHAVPREAVAEALATSASTGLDEVEARARLASYGRNELASAPPRSTAELVAEQLASVPVGLLGVSALLSLATGGIADAVMIAAVVAINAAIAAASERGAERTIRGLAGFVPQPVPALRDGRRVLLAPAELTVGDLVVLERGTLIAADARLVESDDLSVNEATLTGESVPVRKVAAAVLDCDAPLTGRSNMVFRGTAVTGGSATALVTAVGPATEIGRVQTLLGAVRPPDTPIQRQLGDVSRELTLVNGLISAAVVGLGLLRGQPLIPILRSAISLAVAAIPEGLPAVATTTLALGVRDMRRQHILVRRLDAVETLGAVEVVGLDKTGTLTENRMAAAAVHAGGVLSEIDGQGPAQREAGGLADIRRLLFETAALCSDAVVRPAAGGFAVEGSPTESALVEAAMRCGTDVPALRAALPVVRTVLRGDGRKRMSTLHRRTDGGDLLCVKGDPVEVLARCRTVLTAAGERELDEPLRADILKANAAMAGRALRVLGVARREAGGDPAHETDMTWLGLAGLANPVRTSVRPALKSLHGAGIRTVMITGDQSATAFAIARQLDLQDAGELKVLEAGQIADLPPDVLAALVRAPQVFARVSPVDKLNIVRALQADGRIVAMTGDGVNDGPALKAADIGIAMGADGTDVAREVADIVLARDDLDGIVQALRLGRATHANIRKVLRYLVSTNAGETVTMLGAALATGAAALTPIQLLWLNLMSDPLPALALGLEPPEPDVLDHPPHDPRAPILDANDFRRILREGTVMGAAALAGYFAAGGPAAGAGSSSVAFHGLTAAQLLHAFASRSERPGLLLKAGRAQNPQLWGAVGAATALQVGAQLLPAGRRLLGLTPLGPRGLLLIGAVAAGSAALNQVIDAGSGRGGRRGKGASGKDEFHA